MIRSFRDGDTEAIFNGFAVERFQSFAKPARRKLREIHRATGLRDLAMLPGNRLEALKGSRAGQHSIRINDQYRACFVWRDGDAFQVEIVDYH